MTKKLLNDPLRGFPQTIESIMEGSISLMHTVWIFLFLFFGSGNIFGLVLNVSLSLPI